jgi:hypothetical protein
MPRGQRPALSPISQVNGRGVEASARADVQMMLVAASLPSSMRSCVSVTGKACGGPSLSARFHRACARPASSLSPASSATAAPFASNMTISSTWPERSMPSGQSPGFFFANACAQRSTVVSGASSGSTLAQSRGSPSSACVPCSNENSRPTRWREMPLTRTSARAPLSYARVEGFSISEGLFLFGGFSGG